VLRTVKETVKFDMQRAQSMHTVLYTFYFDPISAYTHYISESDSTRYLLFSKKKVEISVLSIDEMHTTFICKRDISYMIDILFVKNGTAYCGNCFTSERKNSK
jgi:hypothetical protein